MQALRPLGVVSLFLFALLAGCAQSGGAGNDALESAVPSLHATETTGVIRGVVVDLAIKPIGGALVRVLVEGKAVTNLTNANGGFGFENLKPGTYVVYASKVGFLMSQTSVEVVANDPSPKVARLTLAADNSFIKPYADVVRFKGILGCGVSVVVETLSACTTIHNAQPGLVDDNFRTTVTMAAKPSFVQNELVWQDNQPSPQRFNLASDSTGTGGKAINQTQGASPIIEHINAAAIKKSGLGNGTDLSLRVFASGTEATVICDPTNSNFFGLLIQNCTYGSGVTYQQPFELFTTVFYGFLPKDGWTFINDGEPTPPA